jgi:methylated-DNA-protein-cysteine methyltransferase-like protein
MEDNFFDKVYKVAREIPYGRVTSYGAIARFIGAPRSARMVGYAMKASGNMPDIPAHRVLNRNGMLSGKHHFSGTNLMEELLVAEGVEIANNHVAKHAEVFWDPADFLQREDILT